jgi:hypothetical protein
MPPAMRARTLPPGAPHALAGLLLAFASLLAPRGAAAQPDQPIGGFVVDLRGAVASLPNDAAVAAARGVASEAMPSMGLGLDVGIGFYPVRWRVVTFGVGLGYLAAFGSREPPAADGAGAAPAAGPAVSARLTALSPEASLNFGHRMGWSYLSGGIGRATFRAWPDTGIEETGESTKTINYGGGARWFVNPRLAFSLDLRFYAMNSTLPSEATAGHPRMTLAVVTAGVSVR